MDITPVLVSFLVSFFIFAGFVQCQDNLEESFTKDAQSALPSSDFLKLFKLNYDSMDQVMQALMKAANKLADTINASLPDDSAQQLKDKAKQFSNLEPEQVFDVFAKALAGTLADQEVLNSSNEKDLANSYADNLKDASSSLDSENILNTLPAIAEASGKVMKSKGLTDFGIIVRNYINNLTNEIDSVN